MDEIPGHGKHLECTAVRIFMAAIAGRWLLFGHVCFGRPLEKGASFKRMAFGPFLLCNSSRSKCLAHTQRRRPTLRSVDRSRSD